MGLNPLSTGKSVQTMSWVTLWLNLSLNPLSTGKSVQTGNDADGDRVSMS